jgi:hypothetical protein
MKAVKRRTILLVVAIALVLSMTVGLALAYFSDSTAAKGGMKVTLGGETKIVEEQPDDNTKVIRIQNIGETDVVVRVAVYGPFEISYTGSGWTKSGDYWYYDKILPAGGTSDSFTDPLTATWKVTKDLGNDYSVVVVQESDQVVYNASGSIVKPAADPEWELVPR